MWIGFQGSGWIEKVGFMIEGKEIMQYGYKEDILITLSLVPQLKWHFNDARP